MPMNTNVNDNLREQLRLFIDCIRVLVVWLLILNPQYYGNQR